MEVRDAVEEALARGIEGWWPEEAGAPPEAALLGFALLEKEERRSR